MTEVIIRTLKGHPVKVNQIADDYYVVEHKSYIRCFDSSFLDYIAIQFKELIKRKWSCEVIITGERRSGKSNITQQIARKIDLNFPQENIVFRVEEFVERFEMNPIGDPDKNIYPQIILDEAGYDLFSQRWYERIQQEMVRLYEVCASKYTIVYMIAPNLGLINKYFRHFGQFWIHLNTNELERGIAEFWKMKPNKFSGDVFYEPRAAFTFSPLEDAFWKEYEERKQKFIITAIKETRKESRHEHWIPILLRQLCKYKTQIEIANLLGVQHQTISHWVNKK